MKCRESARQERVLQIQYVGEIIGVEEAERLEAIDPYGGGIAEGVTLDGLMAVADRLDAEWRARDEDGAEADVDEPPRTSRDETASSSCPTCTSIAATRCRGSKRTQGS